MTAPKGPEDYFQAALEILSTAGYDGLKMTALHQHLGLTSGSFYFHFRTWDDFVGQFLDSWIATTGVIEAQIAAEQDATNRLQVLREFGVNLPHEAEAALRHWASANPAVAEAQRTIDARRLSLVERTFKQIPGLGREAKPLAEFSLAIIVGFQQLHRAPDRKAFSAQLSRLIDLILLKAAGPNHDT